MFLQIGSSQVCLSIRKFLLFTSQMMDYEQFRIQLQQEVTNHPKKTVAHWVDEQLAQLYQSTLVTEFANRPLPKLTVLEEFQNPALEHFLFLNYYFDHIYLLNMTSRPDRLEHMKKLLARHGYFNWSRFEGLNGRESPHLQEWENYHQIKMSKEERIKYQRKAIGSCGSWAILKSMFRMLKDAQQKEYGRILVLQDDNLFLKNFHQEMKTVPDRVPKNWKLLYLGATQHHWGKVEWNRAKRCYYPHGTADGAFAMGIDSSIFREMQLEIAKFDKPVDSGAMKRLQVRYGKLCPILKPNLMIADIRDSDLRKSRDLVKFGQKLGWDSSLYRVDWG